jgi:hypothetical protein
MRNSPRDKLIILKGNAFNSISSSFGSAVYTLNINAILAENKFVDNKATEKGGSLYLSCFKENGRSKKYFHA